jgi:hypothetical protein
MGIRKKIELSTRPDEFHVRFVVVIDGIDISPIPGQVSRPVAKIISPHISRADQGWDDVVGEVKLTFRPAILMQNLQEYFFPKYIDSHIDESPGLA